MFIAKEILGKLIDVKNAKSTEKYFCKFCDEELIIKCKNSTHKQIHFAHKQNSNCVEHWAQHDMSEWHKNWQNYFPIENREVVVERDNIKHIADILYNDVVFEFQHSPISYTNFTNRNNFYTSLGYRVVWVFDVNNKIKKEENTNRYFFNFVQNQFENFDNKNGNIEIFFEIETDGVKNLLPLYKDLTPNSFRTYTIKEFFSIEIFLRTYKIINDGLPWTVDFLKLRSDEYVEVYKQFKEYEDFIKTKELSREKQRINNVINPQMGVSRGAPIDYVLQNQSKKYIKNKIHPINKRRRVRF